MASSLLHEPLALAGQGRVVPYVASWSEEIEPPQELVEVPGMGIAYPDESLIDRDQHGVLWSRTIVRPGVGRPEFGRVHPLRQRRAMLRLLCGVCGKPASRTDEGVLWLVRDFHDDWPAWPERMAVTEPPVCVPCLDLSVRVCPALRRGAVAFRVREFPVMGVRGELYTAGPRFIDVAMVAFDDPTSRWVRAANLLRELNGCTLVDLDAERNSCPS